MEVTLRRARVDDIEQLEKLMRVSIGQLGLATYTQEQATSAARYITQLDRQIVEDGTYFVVERDGQPGQPVGCGGWSFRRKLFSHGAPPGADDTACLNSATDAARIRAFFVHPDWARRGIGRRILERCESEARAAGFRKLSLMATLPGEPLYAACGFCVVRRDVIDLPDGVRLDGATMEKQIA